LKRGRILLHLHAMNGFVGLRLLRKLKHGQSTLRVLERNLRRGSVDRVVGLGARIGEFL
jgi:hypothetical protein